MNVLGLDLSLTSTGWFLLGVQSTGGLLAPSKGAEGVYRLDWLRKALDELLHRTQPDLAVVEGYSFGSTSRAHSIGEWGGLAKWLLFQHGIRTMVIPPQNLKQFVTGKGNTQKDDVKLWTFKRWNMEFKTNDECDAFCLAMMGLAKQSPASYVQRTGESLSEVQIKAMRKVEYAFSPPPMARKRTRTATVQLGPLEVQGTPELVRKLG